MADTVALAMGYVLLSLFIIAALLVLSTIIHLTYVALQKVKKSKNHIVFMIAITLFGIISFFVSISFIIVVCIQMIMIYSDKLDEIDPIFETLILIFDQFGHLSMITVFIIRFKMCFIGSVFGYSKNLMRILYICLILLAFGSAVIIMQTVNKMDHETIMISSIIWELLIEAQTLWLLYLFVSKLRILIKNSLGTSRKNLRLTISYTISEKEKSRNSRTFRMSTSTNKAPNRSGIRSPRSPSSKKDPKSPSPSPPVSKSHSIRKPSQTVLNNQNLVNVMTKMTLLVLVCVCGSMTSMIGNIYVEIFNVSQQTKMWVYLLPVIDMILSSFMLYLQFDFTKAIYARICGKFDIYFIEFCGDLLDKDVDQNMSKEKVLSTTATVPDKVPKMEQNASVQSASAKTNRTSSIYKTKPLTPVAYKENLTLDITEIEKENDSAFRPPSPSPSPIAESGKDVNMRKKVIMPPRPPPPKLNNSGSGVSVKQESIRPITPKTPQSPPPLSPKNSGKIDTSFWESAIKKNQS